MANKISKLFGAQDMTVGSPAKCLIMFSIPMLIGNLAQQLYNTVDSIVVGEYVGDNALAAVGVCNPIVNLLLCLLIGISTGAGIMVSQYFGAKQQEDLTRTIGVSLTLTLISSAIIMVVGALIAQPLLTILDTSEAIYGMASDYLTIYFVGIIGCAIYNIVSGILRGLGDSLMPLVFLLITCGLNIGLDILFVAVFDMSVAGVAYATVISQFISGLLCIIRLLRMKNVFILHLADLKLKKRYVVQLIKLGLPSGLTQMLFSFAAIVVQSLINSFGETVIATTTVVMRVDGFAMMPNFTFGVAMSTFSGQNIGAGDMARVKKGTRSGIILSMAVACMLTAAILLFGRSMMNWFTDTAELIDMGVHFMRILAVGYIAMGVTQSLSGVMRGAGDTTTPMWISLLTTIVIRVPIAYTINHFTHSPDCLYISLLISWVCGALMTVLAYRFGKWHAKAPTLIAASQAAEPAAVGEEPIVNEEPTIH